MAFKQKSAQNMPYFNGNGKTKDEEDYEQLYEEETEKNRELILFNSTLQEEKKEYTLEKTSILDVNNRLQDKIRELEVRISKLRDKTSTYKRHRNYFQIVSLSAISTGIFTPRVYVELNSVVVNVAYYYLKENSNMAAILRIIVPLVLILSVIEQRYNFFTTK
jgi:predicted nuclease with TOPRIM domain